MAKAYNIPNGPRNLAPLFPTIDFGEVAEYYLELTDDLGSTVATTTMNQLCGCEDDDDMVRLHFVNKAGSAIDAINFKLVNIDHEAKSDTFEKTTTYPLPITEHAINRINIKSNDTHRAISIEYNESEMDWIDELFDSPVVWMEWTGGQGVPPSFIPVVISDTKTNKKKQEDRYTYEKEIEFTFSHEKFNIRS